MSRVVDCQCYGDHRDLHVLTHSFPTRRSSDRCTRFIDLDALTSEERAEAQGKTPSTPVIDDELVKLLGDARSEEHTSELQSLMRISYAVFCLKHKHPDRVESVHQHRQHPHHQPINKCTTRITD